MSIALVVLAAGKGTRMQSDLPKVLHQLGSAPLLAHAMSAGAALDPDRTIVVVGHEGEAVADAAQNLNPDVLIAEQSEQLGTGHAVLSAGQALVDYSGDAVILYGDTPFIREETLIAMAKEREKGADLVVLGFKPKDPARYGRLIVEDDQLQKIVEFKDATDAERKIDLCNSGVVMADATQLLGLIERVTPSPTSGEIYLTDVAGLLTEDGGNARVVVCDESETLGIDSRENLAMAEIQFQQNARQDAVASGVIMSAPETVYFAQDTAVGRDAVIEPYVVFAPGVTVETGAQIRAFSHLEGAHVSTGAIVGPYARLRPGTELSNGAKVGNFVEVKNADVGEGAKINHLSYVGDAKVGEAANIGAGTITCNYDGVMKHRTDIGARTFIGSNTMLVAPVTVGDDAMTASGSVITRDVQPGDLAISRADQKAKPGMAIKLFARLRALKARQKG